MMRILTCPVSNEEFLLFTKYPAYTKVGYSFNGKLEQNIQVNENGKKWMYWDATVSYSDFSNYAQNGVVTLYPGMN